MRTLAALLSFVCLAVPAVSQRDEGPRWRFVAGRPLEGLHVRAADMPDDPPATDVALPHRVPSPNTALWYARTFDLPADAALQVEADDGAQVFVDGVQWENDRRTFFARQPLPAGARQVVVRVLNNAMSGGLRRVVVMQRPTPPARAPLGTPGPGFAPVDSPAFQARMPAADRPCDFTLWADSQGGWDTFATLVARMQERPHHFSAGVGDLVNDGSDPDAWTRFVTVLAPLAARAAVLPIVGNHDYDGFYNDLRSRWYLTTFGRERTWFSWSCGPARFIAVDLNTEFPIGVSAGSPQDRWLREEIRSRAWRDARWRVLLVHQPPFSVSWAGYHGDQATRGLVDTIAAGHGLDLVVSGHSHAYEHLIRQAGGRRLHVLITGGAGGALEAPLAVPPAAADRVIVTHHFIRARAERRRLAVAAVDAHGATLDRWVIEKP